MPAFGGGGQDAVGIDAFSFLETTAEVSITFAGFISIFLVLARRDGTFDPSVAFLIRLVLVSSVGCLFFAALPLVLRGLSLAGPTLWRTASVTMLVGGAAVSRSLVRRRHLIQRARIVSIVYVLNAAVFLTVVANIVGWPHPPGAGPYTASLWLALGIGTVYFIDLVLHRVLELDDPRG